MRRIIKKIFCLLAVAALFIGVFVPVDVHAAELDEQTMDLLSNLEPKLIVESYEIVDGQVAQGETFTMKVNVKNTNEYADAINVMITYTSETDNVRLVDQESNQHYEPIIGAGQTLSYELDMEVMDIYEIDTMIMNFMCTYSDSNGVAYSITSTVTPRIGKTCEMKINSLTVAETAMVGAKSLVNLRYSSVGSLPIASASMIITGDISESEKEIPLEATSENEQKYLDYYVDFLNPGEQTLAISFKYTDEEGQEYTLAPQEFKVTVSPYQASVTRVTEADTNSFINAETQPYFVAGCIGIIAVVFVILVIAAIKKKGEK